MLLQPKIFMVVNFPEGGWKEDKEIRTRSTNEKVVQIFKFTFHP